MQKLLVSTILFLTTVKVVYSQYQENIQENIDTSDFESINTKDLARTATLAQAYLELGLQYMEKKNLAKAAEYFERSKQEAQGNASRRAHLSLIYLKSIRGDKNVVGDVEDLDETERAEGYYLMADGWETYYLKNPDKKDYLELAKEYYSFLSARYPASTWSHKTKLKLASLYITERQYDFALEHLLSILEISPEKEEVGQDSSEIVQKNLAWYLMGQILERSEKHKNFQRAVIAYNKVLDHTYSPFYEIAQKRIKYIRRFLLLRP